MKNESGNVLFYILIAVVLFAALNFAVSRMNRGAPESNAELRRVQASEILQSARAMQTAVRAMTIEGVEDTEVSFETLALAGYNYASCGDDCQVFAADGGGMSYAAPVVSDWLDSSQSFGANYGAWVFSGNNDVVDVGTAAPDLLMILPWVRRDVCEMLNTMLGIGNPGDDPPADNGNADITTKFQGTYTASQTIGGGDPQIEGQRTGCFEGGGAPPAGSYHFFQVLIAR